LIDGFPRIPCYSDPETAGRAGSLGESILTYLERGDIFPDVSLEIPGSWSAHTGGPWFLGSYFTKPGWTEDDYGRIADSAINEWIKQR
jgi:hypothetical protein